MRNLLCEIEREILSRFFCFLLLHSEFRVNISNVFNNKSVVMTSRKANMILVRRKSIQTNFYNFKFNVT